MTGLFQNSKNLYIKLLAPQLLIRKSEYIKNQNTTNRQPIASKLEFYLLR
jgi:hypothetical protein